MRLWHPVSTWHPSRSSWPVATLTLAVLVGSLGVTSSLDQVGVVESGRNQARAGLPNSQQEVPAQPAPKKSAPGSRRDGALNNNNYNIPNIINNNNNAKVAVDGLGTNNRAGVVKKLPNSDTQRVADSVRKAIDPQELARQQKERLSESAQHNTELLNKLRKYESQHQKNEVQFQEREQQRQHRQQLLDDYRKRESQKIEREKEQKWLDDVERKTKSKHKQSQPDHLQQQQQQQRANINPNPPKLVANSEMDANSLGNRNNGDNNRLSRNAVPRHIENNNLDSGNSNVRAGRDPNLDSVKGQADLQGNKVAPLAVKYPRDDDGFNNNNKNSLDSHVGQDSNPKQHDSPELLPKNPPEIKVEERRDGQIGAGIRNEFDHNVNDNNNFNHADNNFNDNGNNIFHNRADSQNDPDSNREQLGGLQINWDWDDFSIMFDNYGRAEMKVRRAPKPTTGEPWPMPQYYSKKEKKIYKIGKDLRFVQTGISCDVVEEALARHLPRVLRGNVEDMYDNLQNAEGSSITDPTLRYEKDEFIKAPLINRVEIRVRKPCTKYPTLESEESYDLVVKKKKTFIYANEVWGLLRGLETFGQLVWRGTDGHLYIKETVISDYPRFPHRGLHIDTSRHFLFKEVLMDIIDSMEMNKLNVFHWHIVDDQSFPYESKVFPELSRKGAFHPTYVYSLEDIAEIIDYARMRGVRVLPEFDTPGHTYAWGLGRPELLTQCFSEKTPVKGYLGPLDPSKNSTYRFLHSLFQEIMEVFKDSHMHLGGDEVPLGCWQSNPEVMAFANELAHKSRSAPSHTDQQQQPMNQMYYNSNSFSQWSDEIKQVYEYYENRLVKMLLEISRKRNKPVHYIMWQEVINNNLQLPNDTIIQVWMGDMGDVMRATSLGYRVIYSTCWYLDHIEYGTKWPKYYQCDPVDQSYGYHIDEKKVLGGEAAFWSEYFTNENLMPLMWPRASAVAERLWSNKEVKNLDRAAERLSEHRCRMIKRGINAGEISGPGYCLHSPPKRRVFNETMGCKGGNCSRSHNFVEIEDIQVHLSQRGGSLSDCGKLFHHGSNSVPILLAIILLLVLALIAVTRSSSRLHRMRVCKNRFILLTFVVVLLVYFLCYTTIWMRAFEFSGSIHKTVQEDKSDKSNNGDSFKDQKFMPS